MQDKRNFKRKRYSRRDFYVPGCPGAVKIPENTTYALEMGLKYLKRQMKDVDTFGVYRQKREFTKPSAVRRKQKDDAIRKQQLYDKLSKEFWKDYVWLVPPTHKITPEFNL